MNTLRIVTFLAATLLALGEVARWWGDPRLVPLAFDELAVSAAMMAAAAAAVRWGAAPMAAAWGLFCGLAVSLLVPTLDHMLHGPPKDSAAFYAVVLAGMLVLGIWATWRALALALESAVERGRGR